MDKLTIRPLRADEIEIRVQQVKEKFVKLLLYKDARCDMRILDDQFGIDGWKRSHQLINGQLFCTVSIWSDRLGQWIDKQDLGTESNAEKEKGQASDSFKRACFNLGIGRELYTPLDITIWANNTVIENKNGNYKLAYKEKFSVGSINTVNGVIQAITIVNQDGKEVFTYGSKTTHKQTKKAAKQENIDRAVLTIELTNLALKKGVSMEQVTESFTKRGYTLDNAPKAIFEGVSGQLSNLPDKEV